MRAQNVVSVAAAVAILSTGLVGFSGIAQAPGDQKPQVVSALGKRFFAKADADGAIAKADAALAADPSNLDLLIAAARAHDVALQFDTSIAMYTKAIGMAPNDVRAYRFRGHRFISTRKFDLAIKDLERALSLAPSSFDVVYHLGLAYVLTAQFPAAAKTYRACLDRKMSGPALPDGWRDCAALSPGAPPDPARPGAAPAAAPAPDTESRIGISDWLYRSLRRAGRAEEAKVLLASIPEGLAVKENEAYYRALLFYKGVRTEAQVLPDEAFKENTGVTVGYGLANYYLAEGQTAKACAIMRRLVEDEAHWNAFGFIGAEAELTRANGPCVDGPPLQRNDPDRQDWIQLFNGRDLDGWTVKFAKHDLGENVNETVRAEEGLLKVRFDRWSTFNGEFGHIFYKTPFSYYRLVAEYRFVGNQVIGGPGWAMRNNGLMLHAQDPRTMLKDQDFPISIEVQLLGGLGDGKPRSTANLCTPGTHVVMNGQLVTAHCTNSTSRTYEGDQWVRVEVEAHGGERLRHIVDGQTVLEYGKPQIGGGQVSPADPAVKVDGTPLTGGYIALQAETAPIDFRKVELLNLEGCTDPKASNYKAYFVKSNTAACRY